MANELAVLLDGKEYEIDDFELGELEWLEDHIGHPLDGEDLVSIKAMVGLVYLIKRRDDPEFTLDDARKVKMGTLGPSDDDTEEKPSKKRPTKARGSSTAAPTGTQT